MRADRGRFEKGWIDKIDVGVGTEGNSQSVNGKVPRR